jgi:hypothetical protein
MIVRSDSAILSMRTPARARDCPASMGNAHHPEWPKSAGGAGCCGVGRRGALGLAPALSRAKSCSRQPEFVLRLRAGAFPRERFRKAPTIRAVGRLSALARTTECLEHYRRRLRGSGGAQLSRKEQANARGYTRFRARIGRPCQDDGAGEIVRCFATPPASNVLSTLIRRYCPIREQRSNSLPQGTYAAVLRNAARCSNRSRTTSNGWRLSIQGEKALRNLERS